MNTQLFSEGSLNRPHQPQSICLKALFPWSLMQLLIIPLCLERITGISEKYFKNNFNQKMSLIKAALPILHSSMKKKIRQIRLIFDIENVKVSES